ncbi:hypothetical protein HYR99_25155 [Candidatus Poribacteria bacterium]|nr:hypothetical protein [Candidatus Poribacteria bacterium]
MKRVALELYDTVLHHIAEIDESKDLFEMAKLKARSLSQGDFAFAGTR